MEATITNISYRYRAPVRYLVFTAVFMSAAGLAAFFFAAVTPWLFRAIMIFVMTVGFVGGLAFLAYWLKSLGSHLCFSQDAVMLPYGRRKRPVVVEYSDISSVVEEKHTYGRLLVISSADGCRYTLDETWLQKGRFDEMAALFRARTTVN